MKKSIVLSLCMLIIACMGGATIIEKLNGKEYAAELIYGSWWFVSLWAILTAVAFAVIIKAKMHRKPAVLLLHCSFAVILLGAFVTHVSAEEGSVHLRKGMQISAFIDKESMVHRLPFTLQLTEFDVVHYPGTDAVMDYRADIVAKVDGEERAICVSMNNIGRVGDYRFYQSSYDMDGEGTELLVAHDPYGIAITYFGYVLLLVSLLWIMFSKHTYMRRLYRIATRPALALMLLFALCGNASAATTVNKDVADEMGQVAVLYNGRICPLNTAAVEFVTKLSGRASWEGLSANEIFLSWMIYYSEWESEPIIQVKNADVQSLLGISGKWASVRDFYTSRHEYKLQDRANDGTLPEATRKAVRDVDEKLQVVSMFYNGEMLRIFPLATDGKLSWYAPGSTELPRHTPEAEFQFVNHAMDHLVKCILNNDVSGAKTLIAKIRLYQKEKAADVLPSAAMLRAETVYNALQSARWVVMACLTLSLVFCLLSFRRRQWCWQTASHTAFIVLQAAYLTSLIILRWCVSGHVPLSNGFETMLFMAWSTAVASLAVMRRIPVMKAFGPVVASFCMLVSMIAVGSPKITQLMPVLQSPLLSIHVAVVMMAYALFAILTLLAFRCLLLRNADSDELPRLTALSRFLLYPAVSLLAIGIFIGAVWANVSWGTYWSWDPKETWALITLMIYAVPLHQTVIPEHRPRLYHSYVLLAFLTVLITYFGVNYFLTGMHSYAG